MVFPPFSSDIKGTAVHTSMHQLLWTVTSAVHGNVLKLNIAQLQLCMLDTHVGYVGYTCWIRLDILGGDTLSRWVCVFKQLPATSVCCESCTHSHLAAHFPGPHSPGQTWLRAALYVYFLVQDSILQHRQASVTSHSHRAVSPLHLLGIIGARDACRVRAWN